MSLRPRFFGVYLFSSWILRAARASHVRVCAHGAILETNDNVGRTRICQSKHTAEVYTVRYVVISLVSYIIFFSISLYGQRAHFHSHLLFGIKMETNKCSSKFSNAYKCQAFTPFAQRLLRDNDVLIRIAWEFVCVVRFVWFIWGVHKHIVSGLFSTFTKWDTYWKSTDSV